MTVKMCIKPFASPINKFTESGGVCKSFHRNQVQDKHLHYIKNTNLKKIMPKKPQIINRGVAFGNAITTQKLNESAARYRHGLRAANERTSTKKDKDFIYNIDKLTSSAPKFQVKNAGDNFMFLCDDQNQEEEREGGIADSPPTLQIPQSRSYTRFEKSERKVETLLHNEKTAVDATDSNHNNIIADGNSGKASAGTMLFVNILLHTLSCSLSCQQTSCRKMGMVLKHYRCCQEKRRKEAISRATMRNAEERKADNLDNTTSKCNLCQQFAKIVAQHSMYLCKMSPNETGCPVPMCDMMRKIRESRKHVGSVEPMQS